MTANDGLVLKREQLKNGRIVQELWRNLPFAGSGLVGVGVRDVPGNAEEVLQVLKKATNKWKMMTHGPGICTNAEKVASALQQCNSEGGCLKQQDTFSAQKFARGWTKEVKNFASKKLKEEKKSDEKKSSLSLPEFVFYEPRTETGGEHDLTDSLDPRGVWYRTEPTAA